MAKINQACYIRDGIVPSGHKGQTKEQLAKDQERDENMDKILIHLDLLNKHGTGGNVKV